MDCAGPPAPLRDKPLNRLTGGVRAGDQVKAQRPGEGGPQALADTPGRIGKPVPYRLQQLRNVPLGDLRDRHIPDGGKGVALKNLQPVKRVLGVGQPSAPDLRLVHSAGGFGNGEGPGLGPALPCLRMGRPRLLAAAQRHPIRLRRLTRLRQGDGGIPAKALVRAPAVHPHPQNPGLGLPRRDVEIQAPAVAVPPPVSQPPHLLGCQASHAVTPPLLPPALTTVRGGLPPVWAVCQASGGGESSAYGIRTRGLRLERAVSLATRRMRHRGMAGDPGFEPELADPESAVLPLDESPALALW